MKKWHIFLILLCIVFLLSASFVALKGFAPKVDNILLKLYNPVTIHKTTLYDGFYNQSIAIYDDVIYTFYCSVDNKGFVESRDMKTDQVLNFTEIDVGHANGAFVSDIWRSDSDDTPLFFVSHCTMDNRVSSLYVRDGVFNVHKVYTFDANSSGYLASFVVDSENKLGYTVGTAEGYFGYSQGANTVIGVYDMTEEVLQDDGTYSYRLIDSYEVSEIPGKQDLDFHDGKIWLLTFDVDTELTDNVWCIDLETREACKTVENFLTKKISERHGEGITFYGDQLYLNSYLGYTVRYRYYQ